MTLLAPEQLTAQLQALAGWEVKDGQLTKTYTVISFPLAIVFIGAIGQLAEAMGHHPDLHLRGYNKVTVELSTHSAGGITAKDFELAAQIEALPHKKPKAS